MADDVVINLRTTGGRRAAADTREVSGAIRGIRGATTVATGGLRNLRESMNLSATAGYVLRRSAYVAGAAVAGTGILAAKTGLQFNAFQEQSSVAFTQLIGSAAGARRELTWLQKTAAATPFELNQITDADRQLLAFNFSLKQTHGWLNTIGDVAAGSGKGPEAIERIVTAIGQIRSKGRLQGDELLQLQELGVLDSGALAKSLGMTPAQLTSGNAQVPAAKALAAIKAQFDKTFGGQSRKQAGTFNGQLSTLHDNLQMTLGSVTYPGFQYLRDKVFPALNTASGDINKIFARKDLDISQKMTMSRAVLQKRLGPLEHEIAAAVERMHIGTKLEHEFEIAAPMLINAAASAAPKAAGAFVTAWWHSGMWGKLFTLGLLSKKVGLFGVLGDIAAAKFGERFARGNAANAAGGAAGSGIAGKIGKAGGAASWFGPLGLAVGGGTALGLGISKELGIGPFAHAPHRDSKYLAAQRARALRNAQANDPGAFRTRRRRDGQVQVHVNAPLVLTASGGKLLATTIAQQASDARARRGG